MRRRHQPQDPETISVSRTVNWGGLPRIEWRGSIWRAPGGESTIIESDEPAALMIRRVEFDALLVSLAVRPARSWSPGRRSSRLRPTEAEVEVVARDGRHFKAPIVIAADGVHSVIARRLGINSGWPASSIALDMMEETPRDLLRDRDPSTLWVAYGYDPSRNGPGAASNEGPRRSARGLCVHLSKARSRERRCRIRARALPGVDRHGALRAAARACRSSATPRGDRRGIGAAQLHARVPIPVGGTASASRPWARPAGR